MTFYFNALNASSSTTVCLYDFTRLPEFKLNSSVSVRKVLGCKHFDANERETALSKLLFSIFVPSFLLTKFLYNWQLTFKTASGLTSSVQWH